MTAHRFARVLRRNAMFILGLIIVLGVTFAAVFAPLIAPFDPNELHLDAILKAPCAEFPLGTDRLGRDVLSRLLYGGRVSLWVGFVAVGISISIGALLGLVSGYFGGLVDEIVMRFVDIMLCFPSFFLILAVVAFLEPSLFNIMVVIGLTSWMGVARLVRAETLTLRDAVATLGERERSILALRYYDGKTQVEVADVIGISQAQVSRLEKAALKRLKKQIVS